jgi:hypothetical protein
MANDRLECSAGHQVWESWPVKLRRWQTQPVVCPDPCGQPMKWRGEWPPPKSKPAEGARPYEVLFVALLDERAPIGDRQDQGYLPALLLCQALPEGEYLVWPRYWMNGRFGQDGPQLWLEEYDYLMTKIRAFMAKHDLSNAG